MRRKEKDDLIAQASWLYYKDGLTQEKVAQQLGVSRVSISRMLSKARKEGIVQIRITQALPEQVKLENELVNNFELQRAIVVKAAKSETETLNHIGQVGAEHLMETLAKSHRLGIGWSSTVSKMGPYLQKPEQPYQCTVNEVAGNMLDVKNPYNISNQIARVLNVSVETLSVPAIVQNPETKTALMQEPSVKLALANAKKCDVAFVGLGEVGPQNTMVRTGAISKAKMEALSNLGAVGEVLLRYFDKSGEYIPTDLELRIISLDWESIRNIPYLVVMAIGKRKVNAILGGLKGKLINCLITDTETAGLLLSAKKSKNK